MSVKVGVRVRPYNQRQKDLNCKLCVEMIGPMTRLFDAEDPDKHRDFTFDYSFWSHDSFTPDQKGYFRADDDKYADQQQVFQKVGLEILSNAWEGYHCCLFAYGQTGSGKSYSMVGYGANKGIVPISCEQIFNRIAKNDNPDKEYEVNVSMLEIYNEKVQDLLVPMNKRQKEGLKVREHKTLGIYVQGLSKHFVDNYDSIQSKMQQGSRNRSIAATEMNASSSRAHTIISIEFKQVQVILGKKREKLSVIYLVDLAGSQKVGKTGATGDRLKQAAGINKSLSVLGLVISTLADKAMGKGKGIVVPYRDSALTRILQNALGGNSKTLMVCAISPASDNYEQTLSTLRYADQAKKIQNKAVVNQSQTDKIIRNLTAQKDELREKVQKFEEMFKKLGLQLDEKMLQQFNDAKEQLKFNNMMMKDYQMTKQEKMQIEEKQRQEEKKNKIDLTKPHLSNLNEDPQLSRKINYAFHDGETKIGRRNAEPQNDIEIGGMGIRTLQAIIIQEQNQVYITPYFSGQDSGCYLNGNLITQNIELKHLDRLIFGTNNVFIVLIPGTEPREEVQESKIDTEFAQNELYLKKEIMQRQAYEEKQKKMKEETQAILRKKEEQLAVLQKNLQESQEMRKNIQQQKQVEKSQMQKKLRQEEAHKLRAQIENQKKKIKDSEQEHKQKIKDKYFFEKKLLKTLPKCIELNLIAKQFKRNISMSVKMLLPNAEGQQQDIDLKKRSIKVKVVNRESGYCYWWDTVKLSNRYYIIKDMAEQYFQTGNVPTLDEKDDPFWDPPEHTLIGRAFLTTKALAYMFDNPVSLTIIGQDDHCGTLVVNLVPTDQAGQKNLSEQMDQDVEFQPEQLIDKPFFFNLIIEEAKIPENYQNIYVEYTLKTNEYKSETFKTEAIVSRTSTPVFNYTKLHKFDCLSKQLLEYLNTAKLIFRVFGYEMLPQEKKQAKKMNTLPEGQSPKQIQIVETQVKKLIPENQNTGIVIGTKQPKPVQIKKVQTKSPIRQEKKNSSLLTTASQNQKTVSTAKPKDPPKKMEDLKKKQGAAGKDKDKDCIIY